MSKHTAGTWLAFHVDPQKRPEGKIVVECIGVGDVAVIPLNTGIPIMERKPNAYMLAAAPDMYDALVGIESTYVFLDSLTAGMEPQHTNTVKALAAVRAAIAKAEGV